MLLNHTAFANGRDANIGSTPEHTLLQLSILQDLQRGTCPIAMATVCHQSNGGAHGQSMVSATHSAPRDDTPVCSGPRDGTPVCSGPRDNDTPVCSGPRDNDTPVCSGPRDDTPVCSGPRDGTPVCSGPRDDTPVCSGPRDDTPVCSGPRDNDTPVCSGPRDNDTPVCSGPRDNDTPVCNGPRDGTPVCRDNMAIFSRLRFKRSPSPICHQTESNALPLCHQTGSARVPVCHQTGSAHVPVCHQTGSAHVPVCHQTGSAHVPVCHQTGSAHVPVCHQTGTDAKETDYRKRCEKNKNRVDIGERDGGETGDKNKTGEELCMLRHELQMREKEISRLRQEICSLHLERDQLISKDHHDVRTALVVETPEGNPWWRVDQDSIEVMTSCIYCALVWDLLVPGPHLIGSG